MKILALCGSLRPESSNMGILKTIQTWLPDGVQYEIYDNIGLLPHFDPTFNHEDVPGEVVRFRRLIANADGVIICTPEYVFGLPGSLKNALDWTASSGEFNEKPVAIITASSSGENAHASLKIIMNVLTSHVPDTSTLLISYIRTKINSQSQITDAETIDKLHSVLQSFLQHISGKLPN
ncbi:NAD(P)H-dependent oxidoreductase [Mucilaginibacter sp. PAMB04274]|uniref:NADPH-dependent FMN reductase n=1 Tax=Mucilaginibacter sp. PAMB04274 TaxID=3138568 RepID=UPI0031F6619F